MCFLYKMCVTLCVCFGVDHVSRSLVCFLCICMLLSSSVFPSILCFDLLFELNRECFVGRGSSDDTLGLYGSV